MQALIEVVLPVFLVLGFGYASARAGLISEGAIDGLMKFAQGFAVPVLLFRSIATLDLARSFEAGLLLSFYIGALAGFAAGYLGARHLFGRSAPDAVAIGFCCLFSNTLLLGLPITERAYGPEALAGNFAIISLHAPMLYAFGITAMEWARSREVPVSGAALARQIGGGIVSNPLVIGIACGLVLNLSGLPLTGALDSASEMVARAALPAAILGLGVVLVRYRPEGDMRSIAMVVAISLLLHPAITWALGRYAFGLDVAQMRSAVLTAAMAPGVNAYLFANMYGAARRVAASSVLVATAATVLTAWMWLAILP